MECVQLNGRLLLSPDHLLTQRVKVVGAWVMSQCYYRVDYEQNIRMCVRARTISLKVHYGLAVW